MSKEIETKIDKKISATTLQRFFELIANNSQPSKYTLNILSEFVNYTSFDDLKNKNKEDSPISSNEKLMMDEFGITLFNLCLKNHHFDTVQEYLNLLPKENIHFPTQLKIADSFGNIFRKDKKAREILLPQLAKTNTGRTYFYESFVDIDFINQYYQKAITNFYLPYSSPYNQKKYLTDFIFTKAIEFIAKIKSGDKKEAIVISFELFQKIDVNIAWQELSHPFPYARLMSVYIISEYLKNNLTVEKTSFAIDKIEDVIANISQPTFVIAQLIIAFNYCEKFEEVLDLYNKYESIIDSHQKTSSDYFIIVSCVNNAYDQLNINSAITSLSLDYQFKDAEASSLLDKPII